MTQAGTGLSSGYGYFAAGAAFAFTAAKYQSVPSVAAADLCIKALATRIFPTIYESKTLSSFALRRVVNMTAITCVCLAAVLFGFSTATALNIILFHLVHQMATTFAMKPLNSLIKAAIIKFWPGIPIDELKPIAKAYTRQFLIFFPIVFDTAFELFPPTAFKIPLQSLTVSLQAIAIYSFIVDYQREEETRIMRRMMRRIGLCQVA